MSIRAGLLVICAAVFVLIAGSLYVVSRALDTQSDIAQAEVRRYHSYKLADELRQSSDDLTRMARLYVVTGEARYRTYFERILAIRDGRAPRPLDYDNVYWDFVVAWDRAPRRDGPAVALEQLMRDAHFTDDELAFLRQAKARSDALVALETVGMNAVQGRFRDDRGGFTREGPPDMDLARRLLHGPEYHRAKVDIMTPIHDFLGRVESRTAAEVMMLRRRGERLHRVAIGGLGTAVILVLVSFALVARHRFVALARDPATSGATIVASHPRPTRHALWTAWPLLAAAAAACASVVMLSWWLSQTIEDRVRGDIRNALETVHQATARSVDDWLTQVTRQAGAWARYPAVREMLTLGKTRDERGELTPLDSVPSFVGYLVVDLDGRIRASDNQALVTLTVAPELRNTLISAAARSPDDTIVVLPDGRRPEPRDDVAFPRDIVVAAAVRDDRDRATGVLVLRVDPRADLSRILDRGRLGESGQSYAFGRTGRHLTESRFGDRAAPAGQPLSTMARAALAGRSGLDVDGYRDYRGVPVIGAWTWNEHYGMGIATEVGLDDAYSALAGFRRQTRVGTGLAVLLIVALTTLFASNRLAMAAAAARLESAHAVIRGHKERMEEELRVGRELQLSMVPRTVPGAGKRDDVAVHATLRPARELGGDFYDFFFVDADHLFFCVGDVSDKGVPAALFMAMVKTLIRARGVDDPSPASLVTSLNAELARDNEQCMFVTLFAGRLDTRNGELIYTSAGHDPPYLCGIDGAFERLEERHGPLAGVTPGIAYGDSRRRLSPGDLLVVFTDGVTEARSVRGDFFSEERAAEIVKTGAMSAVAVVDRLVADVDGFTAGAEQADDITILAVQFRPPGQDPTGGDGGLAETLIIHNRSHDLEAVDALLDRLAEHAPLAPDATREIRIVCDEVLANIMAYGFPDEAEHEITVGIELAGGRLVLTVSDDGVPFDPLTVPAPDTSGPLDQRSVGGLGIHLVRHLVDQMTYERRGDRNILTLVKAMDRRLPPHAATSGPGTSDTRPIDGRGDAQMEIRTRRAGDVVVVDMVGRLDSRTAGPASSELNQIAQGGHGKLVLNVQGLEYLSSAGLRAILVAAKLVQAHGGAIKICDANATVKRVMEVSGVSSLLHLYDTEKDALAAFA